MDFYGKDFLKLLDYSPEEIEYLIDLAIRLKGEKKAGIPHRYLEEIGRASCRERVCLSV